MKKLIAILAIMLVGIFGNLAVADPPGQEQEIYLTAGPLNGTVRCDIRNYTDDDIDVDITFCPAFTNGVNAVQCDAQQEFFVLAGHAVYEIGEYHAGTSASVSCDVRYVGKPKDIKGMFCSQEWGCAPLQRMK